jgi:hypothetical protein
MGTPTASAESGTAEEIARMAEAGNYVAILRSRRPVDASRIDLEQAARLEEYLAGISNNALILDYQSDDDLSQRVDTVLVAAVSREQGQAELELQQSGLKSAAPVAEVWPRAESTEDIIRFGSGRTMRTRNWLLVLYNTGDAPALDVRVMFEPYADNDVLWRIYTDPPGAEPQIESLAPHGEIKYSLITASGMATQARCIVSWSDDRGKQENVATLRLV